MQARARATRTKLLDHTVEALVATGYSGTTTQEVCRRADVSRGTLQYHFPNRTELLTAALDHVLSGVVHRFVAEHVQAERTPQELIAAMWTEWQGPALTAWLELAVAARTNDALREPMREVMTRFDALVAESFATLMPTEALPPEARDAAPFFVFAVLNGLAVGRSYEHGGNDVAVLNLLQQLASGLLVEAP